MPSTPTGLHHVTAIATDPQRNVDFYRTALGLRLVKRTVNFDAPDTYHLYFGNESGQPGTLITFFSWPNAPRGRRGAGQTTSVAFSVPQHSLGWWQRHLDGLDVETGPPSARSEEEALWVTDPDGLLIELVGHPWADSRGPWENGTIPPEYAIRGLHSVTVTEIGHEHTAELLTGTLGFRLVEEDGSRFRFAAAGEASGAMVDVRCSPEAPLGVVAAGTVHHIAWRSADDTEQRQWREVLLDSGVDVTPVLDRHYFRSIYFREPGGVLFEIATDPPGLTVDEPLPELGTALKLPPWLESSRAEIERSLPALRVPGPDEEITFTPPPAEETP
ncbi:ring-cleaving dioxygenase [Actinopolyspora mortivallis]|uniref:ring-cleaving dioxygenase n=1 Tax=Actinopolyspora mortivallis TaxID=33906 RepID=UPI000370081B|nr:ring-cleaving dioxygenase [Actinopolyspora mortivallis]